MGDIVSWVGVVIAALSLLVAIVAIVKSGRAQHEANAAQRRIVEIEEQREQTRQADLTQAKLRPALRKDGNTDILYVKNIGAAEARNIRVELDGRPLSEHPVKPLLYPMPALAGPDSEISCPLNTNLDTPDPPWEIKITWDDASGKDRTYCSTLTW
jgi:hypothetical protein